MQRLTSFAIAAALSLAGIGTLSAQESGGKKADEKAEKKTDQASDGSEIDTDLPFYATGPVAKIDGTPITAEDFNGHIEEVYANSRRPLPHRMAERIKGKTLKQLIDRRLLESEVEAAGIEVSDEELSAEIDAFKDRFPNEKSYKSFLKFRGLDEAKLKEKMRQNLEVKKLVKEREDVKVTDEDAKKYYEDNPGEFENDEKVKASHILIKTGKDASKEEKEKARKRAQKIAEKARKKDADFAKLAKENSEGPSARKGGDLGYFTRNRMVKPFAEKVFSMKTDEVSDPVKTRFGYHVIKKTGHKKASKTPFKEAKADIVKQLETTKMRKAVRSLLETLRAEADIEKMPDNIKVTADKRSGGTGGGMGMSPEKMKKLKKRLRKKMKEQQKQKESGGSGQSDDGSKK